MTRRSLPSRRSASSALTARTITALAFLLQSIALTQTAVAAHPSCARPSPDFEYLDHVIDGDLLDEVCDSLGLSEAQRGAVRREFDPYFVRVVGIETAVVASVDRIIHPESGELPPDWLHQMEQVVARGNLDADTALSEFYESIKSYLTEAQLSSLESTKRMVRRRNHLKGKLPRYTARFTRRVDLRQVFLAWPEFADIADRSDPKTLDMLESVESTLVRFELDTDQYLRKRELLRRLVDDKFASQTLCEYRQVLDRYWSELVLVLEGGLAPELVKSWELYFWRTQDDVFFKPLPLDEFIQWLDRLDPLTEEMHAALVSIFNDYVVTCHERRARLYARVTPMCRDALGLRGTGQPQVAFARALAALLENHQATIERIAALLPEQAAALRARFEDRWLVPTMSSGMDVHPKVVAGLIDPETYTNHAWNRETQQYEALKLYKDPETGIWKLPTVGQIPE